MNRWILIAGIILVAAIVGRLAGFGLGKGIAANSDYNLDACMKKYAVPARSPLGSRAAADACNRLANATSTQKSKDYAHCVLDQIPNTQNDFGVRAALATCDRE